ncbi:conserved hypothetical protein [Neospora caninum Liverpool]|uniref:Uncharacterized protein n=1 Tax=Neospora caninum (strain Liverpool) TaxID=572307 RepID=F0VEB4_NEOCL|nr:conserved hypothetical protein [Neospora caninum Liverpool]CBZ52058.1 conserved hypothetical protein [Neospora caninum Liverpool]|eukprot:XP_003882090.1 conserved hypothetical protein [Neospora caninum Liverpool]
MEDNGVGSDDRETDAFSNPGETPFSGLLSRIVDDATSTLRAREEALAVARETGESGLLGGFRYRLTRRILEREADRMLLLGTGNYLVVLGNGLERKCAAAACLLLSWKYAEDSEESRCTRKLYDLARGMYRVSVQQKVADLRQVRERLLLALEREREAEERREEEQCKGSPKGIAPEEPRDFSEASDRPHAEVKPSPVLDRLEAESVVKTLLSDDALADLASSSRWLLRDSAVSFRILCHKLRIYESALLRAIRFNVGPLHLPVAAIRFYVKAFLTRCERVAPVTAASPRAAASSFASPSLPLSPAETPPLQVHSPEEGEKPSCPSEERQKAEETSPAPSDLGVLDGPLSPHPSAPVLACPCAMWPARGLRYAQLQRRVHEGALQEFLLLCRTPFVLERQANAIAAACVIRAAILAGLSVGSVYTPAKKARESSAGSSAFAPKDGCRLENEEGKTEEDCILEALTAFSAHVDRFLQFINKPLDERTKGTAGETGMPSSRLDGGLVPDETKERDAHQGAPSSSPPHGELEEKSGDALRTGAGLYGVNRSEVQAVLSDLRQAAEWQLDLLHGPSPTFPCLAASSSLATDNPDQRDGATGEAKGTEDQAEDCRGKTEEAEKKRERNRGGGSKQAEDGL